MSVNFRKRVKVVPGINLNFSKKGVSTSIGPQGAKININKHGAYASTSIPGTGIYSRQKITTWDQTQSRRKTNKSNTSNVSLLFFVPTFAIIAIAFALLMSGHFLYALLTIIIGFILLIVGFLFLPSLFSKRKKGHLPKE